MKRFSPAWLLATLLMLPVISAPARKGLSSKLSPFLQRMLLEHRGSPSAAVMRSAGSSPQAKTLVFVCADEQRGDSLLQSYSGTVYDQRGDLFIVLLPVDSLERVAGSPMVKRLEASAPCTLQMDTTRTIVAADAVHEGRRLPQAFDGEGVVVGVMDIGFDLTHPNFLDVDGRLRIRSLWDMLAADTMATGRLPMGRTYTDAASLAAVQHTADGLTETHGTHTAGIAAGSGYGSAYRGMAPGSDLCLVCNAVNSNVTLVDSLQRYLFTTAADALGFKYLFDYAQSQGKPCVASFSEGYMSDTWRQDSLYSTYLSRLVGPGRILVASAGNQGGFLSYLPKTRGLLRASSVINMIGQQGKLHLLADAPLEFKVATIDSLGGSLHAVSFRIDPQDDTSLFTDSMTLHADRQTWLRLSLQRLPVCHGGAAVWELQMETNASGLYSSPRTALTLKGSDAEASLWTGGFNLLFVNAEDRPGYKDAEAGRCMLYPGAFESVIAVGATIHRTGFTNYRGIYKDYSQKGRNDGVRAGYSSMGPTIDGRIKPDVMAPGSNIVSSYNSFYLEANPDVSDTDSDVERFTYHGRTYAWNSNTGTSMSTPVVAGAIALWLQACPDLSPTDILDLIRLTSRHPEDELDYPNNQYGHGEINAYLGLLHLLGIDAIEGISGTPVGGVRFDLSDGALHLQFERAPRQKFRLRFFDLQGRCLTDRLLSGSDTVSYRFPLPVLPAGVYAVQIDSREPGMSGSQLLRLRP